MTAANTLEIKGKLVRTPLAELIVEIAQTKLDGSLRLSSDEQKVIVYFDKGRIVFAVSNSRKHRLFQILLDQEKISKEKLVKIENFTNDLFLAKSLVKENLCSKEEIDSFLVKQIERILKDTLYWKEGEWNFDSLARIKQGLCFDVNIGASLFEYAKSLDWQKIQARFKSFDEEFGTNPEAEDTSLIFSPQEAFILSRIGDEPLTIEALRTMSGLTNDVILKALYALWLGGLVFRYKWNAVFNQNIISKINSTPLTLKTSALSVEAEQLKAEQKAKQKAAEEEEEAAKAAEAERLAAEEKAKNGKIEEAGLSLEEYLDRMETAATHYDIFGLKPSSELAAIKKVYFRLAKNFHPDLFHKKVEPELHARIQTAFTELAHAYETLKDEETREVYDFKLRKVLEALESQGVDTSTPVSKEAVDSSDKSSLAAENFDSGYDLLMDQNYYEALPYLGRAVHLEDDNARYHAFYGKALSFDKAQRHKAEAELQTAVKLDPENTIYRIMLVELFIEIGLKARAKGELNRLLEFAPENKEAQSLLDSLG